MIHNYLDDQRLGDPAADAEAQQLFDAIARDASARKRFSNYVMQETLLRQAFTESP